MHTCFLTFHDTIMARAEGKHGLYSGRYNTVSKLLEE